MTKPHWVVIDEYETSASTMRHARTALDPLITLVSYISPSEDTSNILTKLSHIHFYKNNSHITIMSQPGRQVSDNFHAMFTTTMSGIINVLTTSCPQDFSDKVHNAVKPDSQKTFTEHVGDMVTGKADSAGSTLQPQQDKSTGQKLGDAVSGQQLVPSPSQASQASC